MEKQVIGDMNSRGQTFSTFQLLISAIVALAILVLLLNILDIIPKQDQQVSVEATNLIKSQNSRPSELRTSSNKVVVKTGDSLNAKSLANQSGSLTEEQLCISKGDFANVDDFAFTDADGTILRFNGSQLSIKISVICDTGSELEGDLLTNGISDNWMDSPQCQDVAQLQQQGCIVALRYA
ncbi:MAG: hypothetical protein Q8P05_03775 [Candidatus Diapherotrites archaeon]|nr:hypothetical protein [Candidatus Diapherotrites archaeon]MDZ4256929.1 hypothetical protein [archaeon]